MSRRYRGRQYRKNQRRQIPGQRAAKRGDHIEGRHDAKTVASAVALARDAGEDRAQHRTPDALATVKPSAPWEKMRTAA